MRKGVGKARVDESKFCHQLSLLKGWRGGTATPPTVQKINSAPDINNDTKGRRIHAFGNHDTQDFFPKIKKEKKNETIKQG